MPSIDFTAAELSGPKITISLTSRSEQDVEPLDRVLGAGRHLLALINDIPRPLQDRGRADQMGLRQALLNLMSNANKFTEKSTRHHRRSPGTGRTAANGSRFRSPTPASA